MFFATVWSVIVMCSASTGAHYNVDTLMIQIPRDDCKALSQPGRFPAYEIADAVFTLAHEEGHAHDPGLTPEALATTSKYVGTCGRRGACEGFADCYGAEHMEALALTLGFSHSQARRYRNIEHGQRFQIGYAPIPQRCWS